MSPIDSLRPVRVNIQQRPAVDSPQGQLLTPVISTATAPVSAISAGIVRMPRGGIARAHLHRRTELIVYVLNGYAATLWGPYMEPLEQGPGSMVWIPAGCPHTAINLSETEGVIAIETRTDPAFNDDVELLPELDAVAATRIADLRETHRALLVGRRISGNASW